LLVSTYELGHQPLHVASPAAALDAAGHDVAVADTSVERLDPVVIRSVDAVAVSVPMHTATRLAGEIVDQVRSLVPGMPVALYGLYAGQGSAAGVSARFVGEYEADLVEWASAGAPVVSTRVAVAHGDFHVPARASLPGLESYGRLVVDGGERLVGYVEASHGCRHRCRHCPLPSVYDGRYRIVGADVVLADVDRQVEMGARHITWGDPDFLNGPRYSIDLLEEAHRRHPDLSHDLTIKVEHLRRHDDLLPRLAAAGTLFVVSAFETTDDRTLAMLDKGHTVADMTAVVDRARSEGIDIRPSWMPFVPWTVPHDVVGIFRFLAEHDLLGSTDPVQMSIRLLIPRGSLMLELPEVSSVIAGYDEDLLTYRWSSADPRSDELQRRLAEWAESGADDDPVGVLVAMWRETVLAAGGDLSEVVRPASVTRGRPRLTEPWFCCAEPTRSQSVTISGT
jgi:hypothetical protein